jgi:hypothetical protein
MTFKQRVEKKRVPTANLIVNNMPPSNAPIRLVSLDLSTAFDHASCCALLEFARTNRKNIWIGNCENDKFRVTVGWHSLKGSNAYSRPRDWPVLMLIWTTFFINY